jgi:hypothetical protein
MQPAGHAASAHYNAPREQVEPLRMRHACRKPCSGVHAAKMHTVRLCDLEGQVCVALTVRSGAGVGGLLTVQSGGGLLCADDGRGSGGNVDFCCCIQQGYVGSSSVPWDVRGWLQCSLVLAAACSQAPELAAACGG